MQETKCEILKIRTVLITDPNATNFLMYQLCENLKLGMIHVKSISTL